jgi:hypothetical protein
MTAVISNWISSEPGPFDLSRELLKILGLV